MQAGTEKSVYSTNQNKQRKGAIRYLVKSGHVNNHKGTIFYVTFPNWSRKKLHKNGLIKTINA
ncbi:hypothetical protein CA303_28165 [Salmonella enterica subsp. enterica serovar Enteritidis]|nr:hypothetical protein CA303_28165 [Salmonella enterica subsp. enterica serovar Enteritidis]